MKLVSIDALWLRHTQIHTQSSCKGNQITKKMNKETTALVVWSLKRLKNPWHWPLKKTKTRNTHTHKTHQTKKKEREPDARSTTVGQWLSVERWRRSCTRHTDRHTHTHKKREALSLFSTRLRLSFVGCFYKHNSFLSLFFPTENNLLNTQSRTPSRNCCRRLQQQNKEEKKTASLVHFQSQLKFVLKCFSLETAQTIYQGLFYIYDRFVLSFSLKRQEGIHLRRNILFKSRGQIFIQRATIVCNLSIPILGLENKTKKKKRHAHCKRERRRMIGLPLGSKINGRRSCKI